MPLRAFVLGVLLCAAGCMPVEFQARDGSYGMISTTARQHDSREVVIELFGALVQKARTLVAWARVAGPPESTRRLGLLAHRPISPIEDQGLLRASVPRTPLDVLITVESSADVDHPSGDIVATAHLGQ